MNQCDNCILKYSFFALFHIDMEILYSPPRMQLSSHSDFEGSLITVDSVGGELYMLGSIFIPFTLCFCMLV